mgnify:CR=1 FL=1
MTRANKITIFIHFATVYDVDYIKDEKIFICDGASGLKVYDKTDVNNLVELNHFKDINTFEAWANK